MATSPNDTVIISISRTPLASFNGSFASVPGTTLCGVAINDSINKSKISPTEVNSVFVGNVVSAGNGQNPAKQASLAGGLPNDVSCTLVNKVCCSSLKALTLGCQEIKCGDSDVIVVAGFESMTRCPHLLEQSRAGYRMGDVSMKDSLIKDGLWDAKYNKHMGSLVDELNDKHGITREEQDRYALQSFDRAIDAWNRGVFDGQIVPVETRTGKVEKDENMSKLNREKLVKLRPSFSEKGTITAANASGLSDGAAAAVICSREYAEKHDLKPIARIVSYADAGRDPAEFPLAPVDAAKRALKKANMEVKDIDIWEVNEAFSSVPLLFKKELDISEDIMNVLGGAVAIGHPLGCTGLRIVHSLIAALKDKNKKFGLATLCNGGGGGTAVIVELL